MGPTLLRTPRQSSEKFEKTQICIEKTTKTQSGESSAKLDANPSEKRLQSSEKSAKVLKGSAKHFLLNSYVFFGTYDEPIVEARPIFGHFTGLA